MAENQERFAWQAYHYRIISILRFSGSGLNPKKTKQIKERWRERHLTQYESARTKRCMINIPLGIPGISMDAPSVKREPVCVATYARSVRFSASSILPSRFANPWTAYRHTAISAPASNALNTRQSAMMSDSIIGTASSIKKMGQYACLP